MSDSEPGFTAIDEIDSAVRAAIGNEYRIDRLLGRGGMSVVFLAEELALKRPVALKVFPLTLALEKSASDRFRQEAQIGAALDHPHIAPIHRFGEAPGFLWYAMKYINGSSLEIACLFRVQHFFSAFWTAQMWRIFNSDFFAVHRKR